MSNLYDRSGISPSTYLIHYIGNNGPIRNTYDQIRSFKNLNRLGFLTNDLSINNIFIELANYVSSGMLLDMKEINGYDAKIPIFEYPNYPKPVLSAVEQMQSSQALFLETLDHYNLQQMMDEIKSKETELPGIFVTLYKDMCANLAPMLDVLDYHLRQDQKSMWRLKNV